MVQEPLSHMSRRGKHNLLLFVQDVIVSQKEHFVLYSNDLEWLRSEEAESE